VNAVGLHPVCWPHELGIFRATVCYVNHTHLGLLMAWEAVIREGKTVFVTTHPYFCSGLKENGKVNLPL